MLQPSGRAPPRGGSVWRDPGTGPLPLESAGFWDMFCPQKKMYVALGGAEGKVTYKEHGEKEMRSKQTD